MQQPKPSFRGDFLIHLYLDFLLCYQWHQARELAHRTNGVRISSQKRLIDPILTKSDSHARIDFRVKLVSKDIPLLERYYHREYRSVAFFPVPIATSERVCQRFVDLDDEVRELRQLRCQRRQIRQR